MNRQHSWMVVALAVGTLAFPAAEAADRGWSVGGNWGDADFDLGPGDFDDGSITSGVVDGSDTGWKLFGGFRFNRRSSVEFGYVDLNNDVDSTTTFTGVSDGTGAVFPVAGPVTVDLRPTGFFVETVRSWPLSRAVALFGKLGLFRWDADRTTGDPSGVREESDDGTDLIYGLGLEYRFKSGLALRGEWERFTDVPTRDIDLVSAGVSYRF